VARSGTAWQGLARRGEARHGTARQSKAFFTIPEARDTPTREADMNHPDRPTPPPPTAALAVVEPGALALPDGPELGEMVRLYDDLGDFVFHLERLLDAAERLPDRLGRHAGDLARDALRTARLGAHFARRARLRLAAVIGTGEA
jgi:hypothetical protein